MLADAPTYDYSDSKEAKKEKPLSKTQFYLYRDANDSKVKDFVQKNLKKQ